MYTGGILLTVAAVAVVYYLIKAAFSLAPWVPSKTHMVDQALRAIDPSPEKRLIDLGCGDGRVVFHAARKYGMHATGVEISLLPFVIAKLRQIVHRRIHVSIHWQDLFQTPIHEYDIVFIYGLPKALHEKLEPKLEHELKPGSYVLSYNFSLAKKKPLMEFHEQWRNCYIYRY